MIREMATETALTSLPPELLVVVMGHLCDIENVRNFAQTCKLVHKIFCENYRAILLKILDEVINIRCSVAVEADECEVAANARVSGKPVFKHDLFAFLDRYRTRRAQQLAIDQTFQTPERTIFYTGRSAKEYEIRSIERTSLGAWPAPTSNIARLHRLYDRHALIRQCVEKFCQDVLTSDASQGLSYKQRQTRSQPLSPSETRRIYRAFYRFELYHQIYHGSRAEGERSWFGTIRVQDNIWLCTFPPHECEETATVYQWLDDRWREKFKQDDSGQSAIEGAPAMTFEDSRRTNA